MKIIQRGFNFSQDGPGNRLVYHLQGCNLHCPWCSNPESISKAGCIIVKGKLLDEVCPLGAVNDGNLNRERCINCISKPCLDCFGSDLGFSCVDMDVADIFEEINRSSMLFFDGGGVTFTGGEPTLQFDELRELLTLLKNEGINTAIETNGTHVQLPELFQLIDFLIIDCKHYNSEIHESFTGIGNEMIFNNIKAAVELRTQLLIRIPLINGFNSSIKDAEGFAEYFKSLNTQNCSFELLRYHEYGKDKWAQCGMVYEPENAKVSDIEFNNFSNVFEAHNLRLVRT